MCLTPILIKNPNYGLKKEGINLLKNVTSSMIPVPCGHCSECISLKQMYFVQRVLMESLGHYLFFGTLTYNNEQLPKVVVNKRKICFADIRDIQLMFKRIRNNSLLSRDFRYLVVSEFGEQFHRPHFHFILSLPKFSDDDDFAPLRLERELYDTILKCWARNIGSLRSPTYVQNCTLYRKYVNRKLSYNFDCHYIAPSLSTDGVSNPAYYCCKYMLKSNDYVIRLQQALHLNCDKVTYDEVWRKVKPKFIFSKGFGLLNHSVTRRKFQSSDFDSLVAKHIRKCIDFSKKVNSFPLFIHPDTGLCFPLSGFYRKYFLTLDDMQYFHDKGFGADNDSFYECSSYSQEELNDFHRLFLKMAKSVSSHDFADL